ncbi:MAG: cupin domain-containing protein [Planctomycetales bacterium]|nr:cupin domain-containing protein [bacterium]UNM07262.1 MAG: cupin domain-containing protein [Planctomycetales bacterium]
MSDLPPVIDPLEKQQYLQGDWYPALLGQVNDTAIKLARIHGEFVWHSHAEEDELFLVVKGRMRLEFRNGVRELEAGQMIIVPRGLEHRPVSEEECLILLVEPVSTVNTGDAESDMRREQLPEL